MKVLLLGPYPPPHGGVQTNLVALRRYLRARGEHCTVINLTRHRRANADDVYYPQSALEVIRLLWQLPYDIIHYHLGGHVTPRLLGLSLVCCLLPGRRAVLTFHSGGYPASPAGRTARPATLRGFVFRRFARIIAVNEAIAGMFRRFGVAPDKLRLIQPHTLVKPDADVALPEELRQFFAAHEPVLLSVSLLEPEYDLKLQIDALARVRARHPRAGLVLIGAGSLEQELRAHIASKDYAAHALLCGDVPHESTLRAITESDLFLRTTRYDGDSISVREALHLGVPVIATDNDMRPAGVSLIPVADEDALVAAIERSLTNETIAPAAAAAGAENLEAVYQLYQELMKA